MISPGAVRHPPDPPASAVGGLSPLPRDTAQPPREGSHAPTQPHPRGAGPGRRADLGRVLIAAVAVLLAAAPAHAVEVFVEVNPSTVEAGNQIGIRASCPDNKVQAIARSDAFGQLTLAPEFGFLTAAVRIPSDRKAGTYTVRLTCPEGSEATVQLHVVDRTRPTRGPGDRLRRHGRRRLRQAADRRRPGRAPRRCVPRPARACAAAAPADPTARAEPPTRTPGCGTGAGGRRRCRSCCVLVGLFATGAGLGQATGTFELAAVGRPTEPPPRAFPVLEPSPPIRIRIPSIDVRAPVHGVGLGQRRHDRGAGPATAQRGGVVRARPHAGPVRAGDHRRARRHQDRPSVFHDLARLRPGATIEVTREDRRVAVFKVNSVERFDKTRPARRPRLRRLQPAGPAADHLRRPVGGRRHRVRRQRRRLRLARPTTRPRLTPAAAVRRPGGQVQPVRPARVGRAVAEHPPGGSRGAPPARECSRQPSSAGVRSPLVWLHRAQAATTFSQACPPPRLRGITWSMVSAGPRQYAHRQPSRAKIARRDRPTWVR